MCVKYTSSLNVREYREECLESVTNTRSHGQHQFSNITILVLIQKSHKFTTKAIDYECSL